MWMWLLRCFPPSPGGRLCPPGCGEGAALQGAALQGAALPGDAASRPPVGSSDSADVLSCIVLPREGHGQKPLGNWNLAVVLEGLTAG